MSYIEQDNNIVLPKCIGHFGDFSKCFTCKFKCKCVHEKCSISQGETDADVDKENSKLY